MDGVKGLSGGESVNQGQSLIVNELHPVEVNYSGTGVFYISWVAG